MSILTTDYEQALAEALEELSQQLQLSVEQLKQLSQRLQKEMEEGLKSDRSNVPMLPSWVTRRPTGQETGEYLGLELSGKRSRDHLDNSAFRGSSPLFLPLSGSYVRIYFVELQGQGRIKIKHQSKYHIHDDLKKGPVSKLIDFLAISVDTFLSHLARSNPSTPLALGFVISFPLQQTALNKASVIQWTKDFEITGADGKNIVDMLQTAFQRRELPVVVKAVLNSAGKVSHKFMYLV